MTAVICIDDKNGMMFNGRRQSRDRLLIEDLIDFIGSRRLMLSPFSALLFEDHKERVTVSPDFIDEAEEEDICFIENAEPSLFMDKTKELVIYRWNRAYPSDMRFEADISSFRLTDSKDIIGSSHSRITREVYQR